MFFISIFKKLVTILNSQESPEEIALGASLGMLIGLCPFLTLHGILLFLLVFLLRANIASVFLSAGVFALLGVFMDSILDKIGYAVLVRVDFLTPLWTQLYNIPIFPFTKFYNTIVMGAFVTGIVMFVPVFIAAKAFIVYYRKNLKSKIENMKIMKALKFSSIFKIYEGIK